MIKKIFGLCFIACLLCALFVIPAGAADYDFEITDGVLELYDGPGGSVTIPDEVTAIGDSAFADCETLTSVTIPSGVKSLGEGAFAGCTALGSVTLPEGLKDLGTETFAYCTALTEITIPGSVSEIGESVFAGCTALRSVTIPDGVKTIGESAFAGCTALTEVTLPESVTAIGDSAFYDCTELTGVVIPAAVKSIGSDAFADCPFLIIYGGTNATVMAYARENEIPFLASSVSDVEIRTETVIPFWVFVVIDIMAFIILVFLFVTIRRRAKTARR